MRKIRMGMVGGGQGAFIGAIHRIAAQLDGQIELVCGAFSRDSQVSKAIGEELYLAPDRSYASYQLMFEQEAAREDRMDMVAIVTPNKSHFSIAQMAITHGFHVICDKPATSDLTEILILKEQLLQSDCFYGLTHTYTGYPMVKEARARIAQGDLGTIRKVVVQYQQGWLANSDDEDSKQAAWRLDPRQGISCCMADIGVHAANLTEYITGLHISEVCADLNSVVSGRQLDDDGTVLLRFAENTQGFHAKGVLLASQVAIGDENDLSIAIYGDKASLHWRQLEPNTLTIKYPDKASALIRTGVSPLAHLTLANLRTPAGHPEGYLEAFANIYVNFSQQIREEIFQIPASEKAQDVPGIDEAIRGMAFIETVVAASASDKKWHKIDYSGNRK